MDLKQLQAMGAFVPRSLVKREVSIKRPELKPQPEWAEPDVEEYTGTIFKESVTVFIRRGSSADALEIANASDRERPFVAVFRAICAEDGKPVFPTLEDAMQLRLWLVIPLFNAITSVTGGGPKKSRPGTSSGVASPSPSAAARSRNGRKRSASRSRPSGLNTSASAGP